MSADQLARFRDGLEGHLRHLVWRAQSVRVGLTTERVYTLVGRGKVYEEIAEDARLLALLDRWLQPHYLLSANHAICIYPGEKQQGLHYDDTFYPFPRPRPAISMSTIGAIDAFTEENGGTVMYPGSHLWPAARMQALFADLAAGRATEDTRNVYHLTMTGAARSACSRARWCTRRAGANRSDKPRPPLHQRHYCEPWARQQENFALGVPKDRVARMSRALQALLGYELRQPGDIMGQVGGYHPAKTLDPGWVLPVLRPPQPNTRRTISLENPRSSTSRRFARGRIARGCVAEQWDAAMRQTGFAVVAGHGTAGTIVARQDGVYAQAQRFFARRSWKKMANSALPSADAAKAICRCAAKRWDAGCDARAHARSVRVADLRQQSAHSIRRRPGHRAGRAALSRQSVAGRHLRRDRA